VAAPRETTAGDVHAFLSLVDRLGIRLWLDGNGDGIYGPPENGERYPAEALTGTGTVDGRSVPCISPEWLVAFHTGYAVDANDWADVSALCARFGIPIPDDYLPFQ
jgi:lincosamide nucleotidyltransferase A/C/D/E